MKGHLFYALLLALAFTLWPGIVIGQGLKNLAPQLPGAKLLSGYPPWVLIVTSDDGALVLPPERNSGSAEKFFPSISRDGNTVAAARWKEEQDGPVVIETYSVADGKWTQWAEGQYSGGAAITADGSKLAVIKAETGNSRVQVIDLKTGQTTVGPKAVGVVPAMSWSPDGKRLAYGDGRIEVWDTNTNQHWQIAEGGMPAWSPDGEWVAFLNTSDDPGVVGADECLAVHPDGSGTKSLARLHGHQLFLEGVVWSPDSKTILLNEVHDFEAWTMKIDWLDVGSRKLTRKLKNKMPVFGWAEAR